LRNGSEVSASDQGSIRRKVGGCGEVVGLAGQGLPLRLLLGRQHASNVLQSLLPRCRKPFLCRGWIRPVLSPQAAEFRVPVSRVLVHSQQLLVREQELFADGGLIERAIPLILHLQLIEPIPLVLVDERRLQSRLQRPVQTVLQPIELGGAFGTRQAPIAIESR